ncbi:hypothetical protein LCGC14_2978990, partial [marine sediment metagenome]
VDGDTPTDSQFHWTTEISKEVRRLCPLVAANPPELAVNLWEHNWLVATSCPNQLWSHSRNNWNQLIAVLEDIMPTDEEFLKQLNRVLSGAQVVATLKDGKTKQSNYHALGWWINILRRHHEDKARHAAGGVSRAVAKADALAVAKAEDKKLKVTK